jgi:hypothetical protein
MTRSLVAVRMSGKGCDLVEILPMLDRHGKHSCSRDARGANRLSNAEMARLTSDSSARRPKCGPWRETPSLELPTTSRVLDYSAGSCRLLQTPGGAPGRHVTLLK